ncbi:MAG: NAD(P) transhydrogenase subunit alpha [Bacteroidia bacterium]|nr:NAD(P) transhydrogenase subunit alpha [Bacteroidia bacterium]
MVIGVLKESADARVAIVPDSITKSKLEGVEYIFEKGLGVNASITDDQFQDYGKLTGRDEVLKNADLVICINPIASDEMKQMKKGAAIISMFQPYNDESVKAALDKLDINAFSMDMIPRTTLAQSMDVLSSMASIAGYKSVLTAADHLPRYFPMMITAAGSIRPAKVVVLGAGVAGLQAIATAKRLGAMVEASDVRSAAKEEILSLGAKFIEVEGAAEDTGAGGYAVEQSEEFLQRQREHVQERATQADVIITTAQVRGRKAPMLLPKSTVEKMRTGSVVVDLASSTGGNCEVSEDDKVISHHGVTIIGNSNLADTMPQHASLLYSNNVLNFLKYAVKEGAINYDMEDEIIGGSCISRFETAS